MSKPPHMTLYRHQSKAPECFSLREHVKNQLDEKGVSYDEQRIRRILTDIYNMTERVPSLDIRRAVVV